MTRRNGRNWTVIEEGTRSTSGSGALGKQAIPTIARPGTGDPVEVSRILPITHQPGVTRSSPGEGRMLDYRR